MHDISEVLRSGEAASLVGGDSVDRAACSNKQGLPPKWIGHTRRQELFEHYQYWFLIHCEGEAASLTTFRTVMMAEWRGILKIRHLKQHARCSECARLSKQRSKAETHEDKMKIQEDLNKHLSLIFADRRTDDKQNMLAAASCRRGCQMHGRILKIDLDGMDQSAYKCPRNLDSSKDFASLWRPVLHVCGVIIHGCIEIFFISDFDVKKDGNTQRTILDRSLALARRELADRNLELPLDILIHVA
jgi:hypothetical protein